MTAQQENVRLEACIDADAAAPDYVRQVWERRAARLAQLPEEEDTGERIPLIMIQLGQEVFGLEATYVFDIRPLQHVVPVPRTPDWVVGVVNLRGRIISVVDYSGSFTCRCSRKANRAKPPRLNLMAAGDTKRQRNISGSRNAGNGAGAPYRRRAGGPVGAGQPNSNAGGCHDVKHPPGLCTRHYSSL
jgi:hypothetical protein